LIPARCATGAHIDPSRPQFYDPTANVSDNLSQAKHARWADSRPYYTAFHTILAPNSANCVHDGGDGNHSGVISSAGSRHAGGAHVLMGDGAVKFVTDSIDSGNIHNGVVMRGQTGNRAPGSASPYGLWGALSTRCVPAHPAHTGFGDLSVLVIRKK